MLKSNQLVGAGLLIGSISCVVSCGDPSAVEPELVYAVENRFEETRLHHSDIHLEPHSLDECLVGSFGLDYSQAADQLNFIGVIGNVCDEPLSIQVPNKNDPNVFLSANGKRFRWCGVAWEFSNVWYTLELKGGETFNFGSPLTPKRGWEEGTQDFTVSIAWPKPGDRSEKFCDYGPESHYLRTYRPEISDEDRELFLRVIEERMNE
ncbi:hypothetical protein FRD01_17080 [Microvenator marinus]|uniref:Lipoprotein n=1 Tax=Microvenator marinus TaxID=2600177 RepID=A0A5B8XSJ1_9DELT|nr:hypothetical protein [Microvenator marinus]QED28922.1 hypothetical protein FRD01_17080 [Microvenator marinus]